ncbi:hypothetical protein SANA_08330 [Gottschalkiaceae bacterium SANA]|nr:hypothetical protein SANA_08330 [Gottschalkiaceae bacterium SANA]
MELNRKERSLWLTDLDKVSCQYPDLTISGQGGRYVVWQEMKDKHDYIVAGQLVEGKVLYRTQLSGSGQALMPKVHAIKDVIWFGWVEKVDENWCVFVRSLKNGIYGEVILLHRSEANFYLSLNDDGDKLMVAWSCQKSGKSQTCMTWVNESEISETVVVSDSEKTYRPAAAVDQNGNLFVVYDRFNGKFYDLVTKVRIKDEWSAEQVISRSEEWATYPKVKASQDGILVFWYDFGREAKFSYNACILQVENQEMVVKDFQKIANGVDWYQDISLDANQEGIAVCAYTWGKTSIRVRYRKPGQSWSDPVAMSFQDGTGAVHPQVVIDDANKIQVVWQFANVNGHMDRNAAIIYTDLALKDFDLYADASLDMGLDAFTKPIETQKIMEKVESSEAEAWLKKNGYQDQRIVFGDIHGQSGMSDGVGQLDQYYHFAKVGAGLEFTALTDHDCYPDWMSESEWEWLRTTCRLVNEEGALSALLAYEWTPNEYKYDFGHKNVYYRGDEGELFRSGDSEGMTPTDLFASVKKYKGMAFPHHPAATWTIVSAATDWNFHDEEVQRMVEIYSRHAPFEYYGNTSKYTKNNPQLKKHSVQDALARGYRFGIGAGSDSHQMEHGIEGGIVAAYVAENTRENVFDALYDRCVYATSGTRILVSFRIQGQEMGSEITCSKGEEYEITASVLGTKNLIVELLEDNQVIETRTSQAHACDFRMKKVKDEQEHYYYLRVTQEDEHMAWSSPIWVD